MTFLPHSAWLQTADIAKEREHTQFRLFADNISLPVSNKTTLYDATIDAWTKAMKTLDSLVQGEPHRIDDGAVLLGLSAWHLYPDIYSAEVDKLAKQDDPLINFGGIITLGLKNRDDDGRGIFWSLPLSQARYYGDPAVATRHTGLKESQITFDDFTFVVLGSAMGGWQASSFELDVSLDLIRRVFGSLREVSRFISLDRSDEAWLAALDAAAFEYSRSRDITRLQLTRLINFGQRRCIRFLSRDCDRPAPVFGLTNLVSLMEAFSSDNFGRIALLRVWANMILDPEILPFCTIRYFARQEMGISRRATFAKVTQSEHSYRPNKRQRRDSQPTGHQSATLDTAPHWQDDTDDMDAHILFNDPFWTGFAKGDEEYDSKADVVIPSTNGEEREHHYYVCGRSDLAAVYVNRSCERGIPQRDVNTLTLTELTSLIKTGVLSELQIVRGLHTTLQQFSDGHYFRSLRAFDAAKQLYSGLNGARVDLQVTSRILNTARWWTKMSSATKSILPVTLACITYFESGGLDIDPDSIGSHTFALCHLGSIFVAASLLADPSGTETHAALLTYPHFAPMQKIIGNVGRPGLGFLVTPANPRMRKVAYDSWHMIAHEPFDGTTQDNFSKTSLHLSFTGYELPLDVGSRGRRDAPGYFLETAVSVYDGREWVADIDVLAALPKFVTLFEVKDCQHSSDVKTTPPRSCHPIVSVDTWLELLDPPGNNAVLRAHKNPIARLAAAALATRRCRETVVLPSVMCWGCHGEKIRLMFLEKPPVASQLEKAKQDFEEDDESPEFYVTWRRDDGSDYAFNMLPVAEEESESGQDISLNGGVILIQ